MTRAALILAGGAGTRLWPLSTDENPKQFLRLFDGKSLLQRAYARLARIVPEHAIFVSTNERYSAKCIEQLPCLPRENVLAEPARKNTAPAIAFCCYSIASRLGDDVVIGCVPADQHIGDEERYLDALGCAYDHAKAHDDLVTLGIDPTEANTGFGYLELGAEIAPRVVRLTRFIEKPSRERAEELVRAGNYVWNAGIFVWRAGAFRASLEAQAQEIARLAAAIIAEPQRTRELYDSMPSISIDYALMEKSPNVATVRGSFGWSDVGSWSAVAQLAQSMPAFTEAASEVFVHTTSGKTVAVVGVSNVAVIESPDGVLVIDLAKSELLSPVVKRITG
ncbi:MAG TPA: mannose-1-phosphate guanylyltransferase [Thermoanaerobaculia bacterium]|nr:mannose-1-phosphate guanylyltransferase [Thermoanaerobaculia bacterium]